MNEFGFTTEIPVRFGDLDTLGHVNNVSYVQYLEEGRGRYFDHVVGIPFETLNTVVVELHIEYHDEITRDRTVEVAVRVPEIGESSMTTEYEIRATDPETGETTVAATAESFQVNTDPDTGESVAIPDSWRRPIENWEDL